MRTISKFENHITLNLANFQKGLEETAKWREIERMKVSNRAKAKMKHELFYLYTQAFFIPAL